MAHRIDTTSNVDELPAPLAPGDPGYWVSGNSVSGQQATTGNQDWFNMVQEEIIAVAVGGGQVATKGVYNQMYLAIKQMIANAVAGATVFAGGVSTGTAAAQVIAATTPGNFAFEENNAVIFVPGYTSIGGGTTLDVVASGAIAVEKESGGALVAIGAGDLVAGVPAQVISNGLVWVLQAQPLGFAAYKTPTDNSQTDLVSANGAFTIGDILVAADVNGTAVDGGALPAFGQAATKSVTDNTKASVASVTGAFTIGHVLMANDVNGTAVDGGAPVSLDGLGNAAFKTPTDNTQPDVASVKGAFTAGHIMVAADASGTAQDGGALPAFGTAAAKYATNAAFAYVASVENAFTPGHLPVALDDLGSLGDSGLYPICRVRVVWQAHGSHSWVVPAGIYNIFCRCKGAGGGGAGSSGADCGGAGAEGGYSEGWIAVTPGQTLPIVIGLAGSGCGTNATAGNGGSSSIGSFMSATGGNGGEHNNPGFSGGTPGNGTGGDFNLYGGDGCDGYYPPSSGKGTYLFAPFGGGGTNAGDNARGPGCGGGGAYNAIGHVTDGGNGNDGYVILEY